ncbi:ABC transporter substrate-binding protein [Pseudochelatococcus sp. B33]
MARHVCLRSAIRKAALKGVFLAPIALFGATDASAQNNQPARTINHKPADAGFKTDYASIVAAAEQEPPLHFCQTFSQEEWDLFIAGFKKAFPNIKDVETSNCLGTEPRERVIVEWQANRNDVDMMNVGEDLMKRIEDEDIGATPDWSVFDGSPLQIDKEDIAPGGRIVGVGSATAAIVFNKKMVSADQVPHSFKECADPKYKGKIIVDVRPGIAFAMMPMILGDEGAVEWAKALAANDPLWARSPAPVTTALLQGERPIACGLQIHGVLRGFATAAPSGVLAEGTDLDFVVPTDQSNSPGYVAPLIGKHPAAPNTALLLVAYAASSPDAISAVNPGYGSPYTKGSWKADYYAHAGVTPNQPPEGRWAVPQHSERAAELILGAWGYPQPAVK